MTAMIDQIVRAKLEGLYTAVAAELRDPHHNNYGGKRIVSLFERFNSVLSQLLKDNPELFSDIPTIDVPEAGNEGQLPIGRPKIQELLSSVDSVRSICQFAPPADSMTPVITREGVYFAGQSYDALRSVQSIIETAVKSIRLIDGYLDTSVLDLLALRKQNVAISILTKNLKPPVALAAKRFNEQYGQLQIRIADAFHDRFLIVDDRDFYHFGASMKDLGQRGFMFSRIEEDVVISSLRAQIDEVWMKAAIEI
jgi:hypothetical protein